MSNFNNGVLHQSVQIVQLFYENERPLKNLQQKFTIEPIIVQFQRNISVKSIVVAVFHKSMLNLFVQVLLKVLKYSLVDAHNMLDLVKPKNRVLDEAVDFGKSIEFK